MKIKIDNTYEAERSMIDYSIPEDIARQLKGKTRFVRKLTAASYKVVLKPGQTWWWIPKEACEVVEL